jgi:hypothetical protein
VSLLHDLKTEIMSVTDENDSPGRFIQPIMKLASIDQPERFIREYARNPESKLSGFVDAATHPRRRTNRLRPTYSGLITATT